MLAEITRQIDPEIRSDKSDDYLKFYEDLFADTHQQPFNILEVGVFHGGSMLMFAQYFNNSHFLGIDINSPPPLFYSSLTANGLDERVKLSFGSQSDMKFLQQAIADRFGGEKLDIVIDDASHMYRHTKATFDYIFYDYLKPGGIYIIEDWGCGYWPKWPDGNPNGKSGLPKLMKELVDLVALRDRTRLFQGKRAMRVSEEQSSPIAKMIVVSAIVALIKA